MAALVCKPIDLKKFGGKIVNWKGTGPELLAEAAKIFTKAEGDIAFGDLADTYQGNNKIIEKLNDLGGITVNKSKNKRAKKSKKNSFRNNEVDHFTSPLLSELFHTLHIAKGYFEGEALRWIGEVGILSDENATDYALNNYAINENIRNLKNKLFKTIVDYLIVNKKLEKSDYYDGDTFIGNLYNGSSFNRTMFEPYSNVLNLLFKHLIDLDGKISFENGSKYIPNLSGDISKNRAKYDAYNAAIMLSNFDDVIVWKGRNTIDVDFSTFNSFEFAPGVAAYKYTLKTSGEKTTTWINDTHESEGADNYGDNFTDIIINSIPHLNKKGEFTEKYLTSIDFYGLAATIEEFQRKNLKTLMDLEGWTLFSENPKETLKYYLGKIIEAHKANYQGDYNIYEPFKATIDIIFSINDFLGKHSHKEKDNINFSLYSALAQPLNNSYGATYGIYVPSNGSVVYKELYSHNVSRIQLQGFVYSKLLSSAEQQHLYNYEEIEDLSSDIDFSNYIKKRFQITIPSEDISELKDHILSKTAEKTDGLNLNQLDELKTKVLKSELKSIIATIFGSGSIEGKSAFSKILEREERISKNGGDETDTATAAIGEVIGKLGNIIDVALNSYLLRPVTTISTASREKIPTFKLANLAYADAEVLLKRIKFEKNNEDSTSYRSLFTTSKNPILLGTTTKLEIVNSDVNKSASSWLPVENFTASFIYDFLGAIRGKTDWLNVVIGNYSDKNTILAKKISIANSIYNDKLIIGGNGEKLTISELKDLVRTQQHSFLSDLYRDMITKYKLLFPDIEISSDISTSKTAYNAINKKLNSMSQDALLQLAEEKGVELVEEKDYSTYKGEKGRILGLNQNLFDNFEFYKKDSEFNKFMNYEMDNLIFDVMNFKKGPDAKYLLTNSDLSNLIGEDENFDLSKLSDFFGIDPDYLATFIEESIEQELIDDDMSVEKVRINLKYKNADGEINPLLQKWMLTNMLFRNEYLNLTIKHEYMHTAKGLKSRPSTQIGNIDEYALEYAEESSARYAGMAKRNVAFTSTYEVALQGTKLGVPKLVNIAIINDPSDTLYNIGGQTEKVKFQDGGSYISYVYSRMIKASYPGKDYGDTLKRFGTFITDYGSAVKKDAEFIITNASIMESKNSEIRHYTKHKQMLSEEINIKDKEFGVNISFLENGRYFTMTNLKIVDNVLFRTLQEYDKSGNVIGESYTEEGTPIKNLFDIWEAGGAEYSGHFEDGEFKFDESSNDLVYDVITNTVNDNNEYYLKDKMIHVISNGSVFKSGAVNLNQSSKWYHKNGIKPLRYTKFDSSHIGPQLDAGHTADASKIKEITQVISALSQNEQTAHIANEAYNNIAQLIREAAQKYIDPITNLGEKDLTSFYDGLSREFAKHLRNAPGVDLASVIAESFKEGEILPFSNKNFFQHFVRDLIIKLNSNFITRYYHGLGAVLNPSHKTYMIYEVPVTINGITSIATYSQADMVNEAMKNIENLDISNYITAKDKIVYGHPGIGKTYLYNKSKSIIDFDNNYKSEINKFIAQELNVKVSDLTKDMRNAFKANTEENKVQYEKYGNFMDELWEKAKEDSHSSGKQLFASDLIILERHADDFDKFIDMDKETFLKRAEQRGELNSYTSQWKSDIDNLLSNIDASKVIKTDKYLSDIMLTDNDSIVNAYLKQLLPNLPTTRDAVNLTDTVIDVDGTQKYLGTPEDYYKFKYSGKPTDEVQIVKSAPRDLKPVETKFQLVEAPVDNRLKLFTEISLENLPVKVVYVDDVNKYAAKNLPKDSVPDANIESFYSDKANEIAINKAFKGTFDETALVLHEIIGHKGLSVLFEGSDKEEYKNILLSSKEYLYKNANRLVERSGFGSLEEMISTYGFDANTEEGELEIIEELLARQAEEDTASLTWFEKVIGKLQILAAKAFGLQKPMSREGVIELLLMSKRAVVTGENITEQLSKENEKYSPKLVNKNLFDLDSVRLTYMFENPQLQDEQTNKDLEAFAKYFNIGKDSEKTSKYLRAWTQRNLELINNNLTMKSLNDIRDSEGNVDFKLMFGDNTNKEAFSDTLIADIYDDVKDFYKQNNSKEIYNVTVAGAELVLPNMYQSAFGTGTDSIISIKKQGSKYFEDLISEDYQKNNEENYDFKVVLQDNNSVYIKLVSELPTKKENAKLFESDLKNGQKVLYRLGTDGRQLYVKPKNSKVFEEDLGDVIYLKVSDYKDVTIGEDVHKINVLKEGFKYSFSNLIESMRDIRSIVPLLQNTPEDIVNFENKPVNLRAILLKQYSELTKIRFNLNEELDNNWFDAHKEDIVSKLAKKQYASWEKSHEVIAARIPAQSMQSFMPMQNVAYFNTKSNNAYVSAWQIWLQGSDFDIDKAYIMGYGFTKSAQFDMWTNLFDYNSKQDLDAIETLPIPNNLEIDSASETSPDFIKQNLLDLSKYAEWFNRIANGSTNSIEIASNMAPNEIIKFGEILREINEHQSLIKNWARANKKDVTDDMLEKILNIVPESIGLINFINYYNGYRGFSKSKYSLQNSIVSKIQKIIKSPSNQLLATIPVSIQSWHDGAAKAKKIRFAQMQKALEDWNKSTNEEKPSLKEIIASLSDINIDSINDNSIKMLEENKTITKKSRNKDIEVENPDYVKTIVDYIDTLIRKKERFSSVNGVGMFKQQYQAAVGKKDVGIGANGLKVFFALSNYYNEWNNNIDKGVIEIDPLKDSKLFAKKLFINGKWSTRVSIADTKVSRNTFSQILNIYGYEGLETELREINKIQAALAISGFVSGATDNAKELVMAKINAVVDLASMHLYLLSLGYTADEISTYMNSDLVKFISNNIETNLFLTSDNNNVYDLVKQYRDKPGVEALYSGTELADSISTFENIFEGAQEFRMLSSIFGVNGSIDANINELNNFLNVLERSMFSAEHKTFGNDLWRIKNIDFDGISEDKDAIGKIVIEANKIIDTGNVGKDIKKFPVIENASIVVAKIIERNSTLKTMYGKDAAAVVSHILEVLRKVSEIDVSSITYNNQEERKTVSIFGGEFDSRFYIHPNNSDYVEAAREYYNLIKNTINVFDVLEDVPHFREMTHGVGTMFNVALISSKKFNFVFSQLRDIFKMQGLEISSGLKSAKTNKRIKRLYGNAAMPFEITDAVISRSMNIFDNYMIAEWFKSTIKDDKITDFKFSVKSLLNMAGLDKIVLYNSDLGKVYSKSDLAEANKAKVPEISEINITVYKDSGEDYMVDLTTDHGIANFKKIMEQVMFSALEKSERTELGKILTLRNMKNQFSEFGNQIAPTFGISSLNNPVSIENFMKLLNEFNDIDKKIEPKFKVTNIKGKTIQWKDLLFVYNLVVNNEAYGDLRLTPLFQDYMKDTGNVANSYLHFAKQVDRGEVDIFEISQEDDSKEGKEVLNLLKKEQINNILHLALHSNGFISLGKDNLQHKNPDFPINTTLAKTGFKDGVKYQIVSSIRSMIKSQNLIINYKCI